MRKTFTTIALFAVLGTLAVSCQKKTLMTKYPLSRKTIPFTR